MGLSRMMPSWMWPWLQRNYCFSINLSQLYPRGRMLLTMMWTPFQFFTRLFAQKVFWMKKSCWLEG